ncbi:GNAT family N-acetyltransferase [Streptomyces meridianus]|uniref:GNAT family N-acetyltransferase n=1 Tax=Streptomyces meridianus TaxID=2938945 RepID=A0ABT0X5G4_9ACTN|nr:GNAT family N-acetyltransferase [Streptomyces meridianus]MCM2577778.1 GNAT family N-acetyltransferase [Streptomyces meridianus]
MRPFLETERLVLRQFTAGDADELFDLHNDPRVMRLIDGGGRTPRELITGTFLPTALHRYERTPGRGHWAAVEKPTGRFLGWFELAPPRADTLSEAELGYRLRVSAWGRGYGTEGARALVRAAFTRLGVERVFAQTMAVNAASRRVREKAGLVHVRTFHEVWDHPLPGTEHGEVEYELLKADHQP